MILKIAALALVGFVIYIVFFKKNRENNINNKNNDKIDEIDTMFECPSCNTYIAKDDAILSNGKYFCSKECLDK